MKTIDKIKHGVNAGQYVLRVTGYRGCSCCGAIRQCQGVLKPTQNAPLFWICRDCVQDL